MSNVERASYRAMLRDGVDEQSLAAQLEAIRAEAQLLVDDGHLLTAVMCRHGCELFLYLEHIYEGAAPDLEALCRLPDSLGWLAGEVEPFPTHLGDRAWAYMQPAFWFDVPQSVEQFARAQRPDERRGRIARLLPGKVMDYVCHHQAIVREGLLVGDRYQFISVHDDMLFSYLEFPRDREQVNIRRKEGESIEIKKWLDVDPASHFDQELAAGGDFLMIDTVLSVGR